MSHHGARGARAGVTQRRRGIGSIPCLMSACRPTARCSHADAGGRCLTPMGLGGIAEAMPCRVPSARSARGPAVVTGGGTGSGDRRRAAAPSPPTDRLSAMADSAARSANTSSSRRSPEDKLVASLIAVMEAGTTPWRRPWDGEGGGHHVNLISGRRYRGGNPVLLSFGMHLRGSALPYWCGFAEAKARGLSPGDRGAGGPVR